MADAPLAPLRAICLALPEAVEEAWGDPTFRVRDKIFAMAKRGGRISVWCKVPPGAGRSRQPTLARGRRAR